MEQVRFRGKVRIIRKSAERVDGGMDEDAGEQAAAAVKDRDQQKTDRDGKNDLAQVIDKIQPLPLNRLMICPIPKVTLEIITADLILSFAMDSNRSPRKITSSKNPTQSIHMIRQTVSTGV